MGATTVTTWATTSPTTATMATPMHITDTITARDQQKRSRLLRLPPSPATDTMVTTWATGPTAIPTAIITATSTANGLPKPNLLLLLSLATDMAMATMDILITLDTMATTATRTMAITDTSTAKS